PTTAFISPELPPTSGRLRGTTAPAAIAAYDWMVFWTGRLSSIWRVMTVCWRTFCVSTTGLAPETVTVSWTVPGRTSTFTVAVHRVFSSTPSRLAGLNPGHVKGTV